jgi:Protein of unknown function (DUF1553)/Protein of unknown function (DUF1549)/Concanavalin A-like lectin/glucanases superfamily/Planctomycete cytochrome C
MRVALPFYPCLLFAAMTFCALTTRGEQSAAGGGGIDFNRDIRPILSDHCYACHGPDGGKRKAGLRLDRQEDAFAELKSGKRALVAGDVSKSALVERILATDPEEIMPPPKQLKPLSKEEIALLKRWVKEGAAWQKHWSFLPPVAVAPPKVKDSRWPKNAIDRFVLARLEKERLSPNAEAEKTALIRRLTFDLCGLPPTVAEVDSFLADRSTNAYERLVERLLQRPQFGERMAVNWMDLARYADTSGYHFDGVRFMWLWRDWVIKSFNDNKPFDEFTVEQLAGDLLPHPTPEQRVATGFVRNNMTNDEGGADPDEYLNEYVVDRVNTVGSVWLGLTVGCARCHDHKYDPLLTKDFYRLYAFFHNVPEKGLDRIRTDNPPPRLPMPTAEQARAFVEADFTLKDAEKTLADRNNELGETQEKWERETLLHPPVAPGKAGLVAVIPFDGSLTLRTAGSINTGLWQGSENAEFAPGLGGPAIKLNGKGHADFGPAIAFDRTNAFTLSAWIRLRADSGCVLSKMEKDPGYRGLDLLASDRRFAVHLIQQWPDSALKVRTKAQFPANQWLQVAVVHDGSGKAAGVKIYVNGRAAELEVEKDQLRGSILNQEPLRIGSRNGTEFFTGLIGSVELYSRAWSAAEASDAVLTGYLGLIAKSRGTRTDEERTELARLYRERYATDLLRAEAALAAAKQRKEAFYSEIPTTMVMQEMNPPRDTYVLVRGDFRNRGEKVTAGAPDFLPPLPSGPANRLTLARWLVSRDNPLPARVVVNRYWAMFFGTGLVKSVNDFGSQGEWPSHPELLDWLAARFRDGVAPGAPRVKAWDVKELVRLIVTSATYRESAVVSPLALERDPFNRLFTRGPRLRLDAEFVRDNALAVAGLLNSQVGGPSVKPYQPPGIWDGTDAQYTQDHEQALYRRGMYVFWRRSAHYPSFAVFDAPNREVCTFLRQRTQTPLQSLVLMNDPVYVEAARGLAERVMREEPTDLNRRLTLAFRHTLGRRPAPGEIAVLANAYRQQYGNFSKDQTAANALLGVGESKLPAAANRQELAALTAVANVLLNLNETITK